ncbi:hypothetical protein VPH35_090740 [Triticum aestivum]
MEAAATTTATRTAARRRSRICGRRGALEEGKLSSTNGNSIEPQTSVSAASEPSVNLTTTRTSRQLCVFRTVLMEIWIDLVVVHVQDAHGPSTASMLRSASTLGDGVLLIAALCFHSVFEGIAVGVAETKADAWKALWTISLHKILAAIAMGISLLPMLPNRPLLSCFGYAFAFAVSSPIGVGVGILIDATTEGRVADWIYAISMGLATGIFVYVSINHLLAKGYKPQRPVAADTPLGRWLAVVLGVGVIAVVMIWDA